MASTYTAFLNCSIFAAIALTTVVFGVENQSTQTMPFCHEITPTPIDPCTSSPCVTGNCINLGDGQFKCSCTEGWHGSLCDTGFRCGFDQTACLPFSSICNDTNECSNYFDESNCCRDDNSNKIQEFSCAGLSCVTLDKLCDGQVDCGANVQDEFYYCRHPCTVTVPTAVSTATETVANMLTAVAEYMTTPLSSAVVQQSSAGTSLTAKTFTQTNHVTYDTTPTTKSPTQTMDTRHGMTTMTKHLTQKRETTYSMTTKLSTQLSDVTNSATPTTRSSSQANEITNGLIPSTTPSARASDTKHGMTLTVNSSTQTSEATYGMTSTTKPTALMSSRTTYSWTQNTDTVTHTGETAAYSVKITTRPSNQNGDTMHGKTPTTKPSSQTSETTHNTTINQPTTFSTADTGDKGNSFTDETKKIAGITAGLGGLAAGGTTIALASKFCKKQSRVVKSDNREFVYCHDISGYNSS